MLSVKELKIIQAKLDLNEKSIESSNKSLRQLRFKIALAEQHSNEQSEIDDYKCDAKLEYEELDRLQTSYCTIINLMSDLGYCIDLNSQLVKMDKE